MTLVICLKAAIDDGNVLYRVQPIIGECTAVLALRTEAVAKVLLIKFSDGLFFIKQNLRFGHFCPREFTESVHKNSPSENVH